MATVSRTQSLSTAHLRVRQTYTHRSGSNIARQIELGFRLALTREVREGEKEVLKQFHQEQSIERALDSTQPEKETHRQALIQVCRIIFNLNEFVYAD
ncbi:MAG: hypothetical protein MK488_13435 [SAR324 cluster bacterium]|nr:hypothetical protein [SAR324 cluster bacterium]